MVEPWKPKRSPLFSRKPRLAAIVHGAAICPLMGCGSGEIIDPLKSHSQERCMKKYTKPSLKALGLLRAVTQCQYSNGPVNPCWIASAVFDENFFTGPRVNKVRTWLLNDFEPSGVGAKFVMHLYRKYGESVAEVVKRSSILKSGFRRVFDKALAKAEAKYGAL
jgi:hypothetical protein